MGIIGSWEGTVTSPLYFYNNGWKNLQTPGVTGRYFDEDLDSICASGPGIARLNQTVDLTHYNYLKAYLRANVVLINGGYIGGIGISTSASISTYTDLTSYARLKDDSSGTVILDISKISGNYYIYLISHCGNSIKTFLYFDTIFVSHS